MNKHLVNPMRINKPAIFLGGVLAIIAGGALVAWWRVNRIINQGKIVIDVTDQLPPAIQQMIHSSGWLPKKIPLKPIFQTGDRKKKGKATGIIAALSKYFSVKLDETK